ncbi:MAG: glycosyltransferase family 2 protein, partial [Ignavibacteria bacterium]|nr:glycosyltransferase family 2 protein [Ignavibacteria bacterium]
VISIHGYIYPVKKELPETFFLRGADCWGWATWKRGWDLFEPDGKKLLNILNAKNLSDDFDLGGAVKNIRMLKKQIAGKNDSWAIRWHASAFIKNKITLYPGKSLVRNIGADGEGTHVKSTKAYDSKISTEKVKLHPIEVKENDDAKKSVTEYFRSIKPGIKSGIISLINTFKS